MVPYDILSLAFLDINLKKAKDRLKNIEGFVDLSGLNIRAVMFIPKDLSDFVLNLSENPITYISPHIECELILDNTPFGNISKLVGKHESEEFVRHHLKELGYEMLNEKNNDHTFISIFTVLRGSNWFRYKLQLSHDKFVPTCGEVKEIEDSIFKLIIYSDDHYSNIEKVIYITPDGKVSQKITSDYRLYSHGECPKTYKLTNSLVAYYPQYKLNKIPIKDYLVLFTCQECGNFNLFSSYVQVFREVELFRCNRFNCRSPYIKKTILWDKGYFSDAPFSKIRIDFNKKRCDCNILVHTLEIDGSTAYMCDLCGVVCTDEEKLKSISILNVNFYRREIHE